MKEKIFINARIIDPSQNMDEKGCLILNDKGKVKAIGKNVKKTDANKDAEIIDAFPILEGSHSNCAGGPTPWGTWLSCEEGFFPPLWGKVWECDPTGQNAAISRDALGYFAHEAVAVDPVDEKLYLTQDKNNGLLYRFTPDSYPDLSSGLLEAMKSYKLASFTVFCDIDNFWVPFTSMSFSVFYVFFHTVILQSFSRKLRKNVLH